jgi:hypothetical protein
VCDWHDQSAYYHIRCSSEIFHTKAVLAIIYWTVLKCKAITHSLNEKGFLIHVYEFLVCTFCIQVENYDKTVKIYGFEYCDPEWGNLFWYVRSPWANILYL